MAPGRIRRRLALAIVLTALIPVLSAILLAESMVRQTSARFFVPEVGAHLDQSLGLYQELARAVKARMRQEASAIAQRGSLQRAADKGDRELIRAELATVFQDYGDLVSLTVRSASGEIMIAMDRGRPFDPKRENKLEVVRPLAPGRPATDAAADEKLSKREASEVAAEDDALEQDEAQPAEGPGFEAPELVAVFAAERARFDELEAMSHFVDTYKQIERRRESDEQTYVLAFAALLGITIVGAVGVGAMLARGVSSRIAELAETTKRVGAGDLAIRVPEDGSDELAELSRAFNRMLGEIETSRARIEYLQRIGAWQEMARRLAHEIKNPLTPIQLAVQDIHRRYHGGDAQYNALLDTTLEIVEDEVATLRRLVTEFSDFARLPQAQLEPADLVEFLQEQTGRWSLIDDDAIDEGARQGGARLAALDINLVLPDSAAMVYMDRQMLRRALINLVRNTGQAVASAGRQSGKLRIELRRREDFWVIDFDDDGPGIPESLEQSIFDPYVTTKTEGTGLGLAIVKKIVVEHGGSIMAGLSPLGGARIRLRLPAVGTAAGTAALEARDSPPVSSRRSPSRPPGAIGGSSQAS